MGLANEIINEWKWLWRLLLESDESSLDAIDKENREYSEKGLPNAVEMEAN